MENVTLVLNRIGGSGFIHMYPFGRILTPPSVPFLHCPTNFSPTQYKVKRMTWWVLGGGWASYGRGGVLSYLINRGRLWRCNIVMDNFFASRTKTRDFCFIATHASDAPVLLPSQHRMHSLVRGRFRMKGWLTKSAKGGGWGWGRGGLGVGEFFFALWTSSFLLSSGKFLSAAPKDVEGRCMVSG